MSYSDNLFGPLVDGQDDSRREVTFDFTLLFEETVLVVGLLCVTIIIGSIRLLLLARRRDVARTTSVFPLKIACYALLAIAEIVGICITLQLDEYLTSSTLPAYALCSLGYFYLIWISAWEHRRSYKPSSTLILYLLAAVLVGILQIRTLFRISNCTGRAVICCISTGLKCLALRLEMIVKTLKHEHTVTSVEEKSSIVNRSLLWWLRSLFVRGARNRLTLGDLPNIDPSLCLERLNPSEQKIERAYSEFGHRMGPEVVEEATLLKRIFRSHWQDLIMPVFPRSCYLALTLLQPILLQASVTYTSNVTQMNKRGVGGALILAYVLVYVCLALAWSLYLQKANRAASSIRASLVSQLIRHTSLKRQGDDGALSVTLVNAHVDNIQMGFRRLHDMWANTIGAAIAFWILYSKIGIAMWAVLGFSSLCILVSAGLSRMASPHQRTWLKQVEHRLKITSQAIMSIKSIKMSGAIRAVRKSVQDAREKDIAVSKRFRGLLIAIITTSFASVIFAPALGLGIYGVMTVSGHQLPFEPAKAFTALTLLTLIGSFIAQAIEGLMAFVTMLSCLSHVDGYLASGRWGESTKCTDATITYMEHSNKQGHFEMTKASLGPEFVVAARNYSARWSVTRPWLLANYTFEVRRGTSTMIIGPTGCGKTTLLQAMLYEVPYHLGQMLVQNLSVGYCAQTPWLFSGTIRDNIVGLSTCSVDKNRYKNALIFCEIEKDIECLPLGDDSRCENNGLTLSGGQKARIALARAVYCQPEFLILDDCFSGIDRTTANRILERLLETSKTFENWAPTLIMAVSNPTHLERMDQILVLREDGILSYKGKVDDIQEKKGLQEAIGALDGAFSARRPSAAANGVTMHFDDSVAVTRTAQTAHSPSRATQLFGYYMDALGKCNCAIYVFLCAVFCCGIMFPSLYLKEWNQYSLSRQQKTLPTLLSIYFGLGAASILALGAACTYFMTRMASRASWKLHEALLNTVLSAPMTFFSSTNTGDTINRFSQDLQVVDRELPYAFVGVSSAIAQGVGHCALVILGSPFSGIAVLIILIWASIVQTFYLRTSRQLRIIDLEAKAPLASHLQESAKGLITLHAFGWGRYMVENGLEALRLSQKPFYILFSSQILLELVLDLTNAGLAVVIISIAVGSRSGSKSAGLGLALTSVVSLGQTFKNLVRTWTNLEVSLGAVERIREFSADTKNLDDDDGFITPPDWPLAGNVEFENITVSYSNEAQPIIRGLDLKIAAGAKVGVCGQTGCGKTTLISVLVRLFDLSSGVIRIDGVNIATIARSLLSSRLAVLPQHNFMMHATVRENMNVCGSFTDSEIEESLRRVNLWNLVQAAGGLDAYTSTEMLSHGHIQLLSFARIMMQRRRKVLILDEPTSSVDQSIQALMDKIIWLDFARSTVICVAHRLETLLKFDQVVVLDQGRIIEAGHPNVLLRRDDSHFARLFKGSIGELRL